MKVAVGGSSPRSRGPRESARHSPAPIRFIPAFAGTTSSAGVQIVACAVHPRVRGDHGPTICGQRRFGGSSPRSRGPRRRKQSCRFDLRFIPAFAGTTAKPAPTSSAPPVHPRVRGDHVRDLPGLTVEPGSSPRSRGPLLQLAGDRPVLRFIPAFAGTTQQPRRALPPFAVHPRVRGDHDETPAKSRLSSGSSPRSRGPRHDLVAPPLQQRFIPAFAGTTDARGSTRRGTPVHPRVRGDHLYGVCERRQRDGSSPRSRGPHRLDEERRWKVRFIPAFAGTTMKQSRCGRASPVHPRVRGDHVSCSQ